MGSMVVRFPDGSKEFRYPEKVLVDGDVVWHDGERFRVVSVSTDDDDRAVVIVEADSGIGDMLRSEEGAVHLVEVNGLAPRAGRFAVRVQSGVAAKYLHDARNSRGLARVAISRRRPLTLRGCGVVRSHPRGGPRLRDRHLVHRGDFRQRSELAGCRSVRAGRSRHHRRIFARAAFRQPKCRNTPRRHRRRSSRNPPRRRCPRRGKLLLRPRPGSS